MKSHVLDGSALFCLLYQQPGWERVADCLQEAPACVSTLAVCELLCWLEERCALEPALGAILDRAYPLIRPTTRPSAAQLDELLAALRIEVVAFDMSQALASSRLQGQAVDCKLTLAAWASLALAQSLGASVVSCAAPWAALAQRLGIEVVQLS